jgi:hypothetical protein
MSVFPRFSAERPPPRPGASLSDPRSTGATRRPPPKDIDALRGTKA